MTYHVLNSEPLWRIFWPNLKYIHPSKSLLSISFHMTSVQSSVSSKPYYHFKIQNILVSCKARPDDTSLRGTGNTSKFWPFLNQKTPEASLCLVSDQNRGCLLTSNYFTQLWNIARVRQWYSCFLWCHLTILNIPYPLHLPIWRVRAVLNGTSMLES